VAFKNEVAHGQKLSNKALDTLDRTATETFERYKTKAYGLEEKIETLCKSVENLEARLVQQAEKKALDLKMPSQRETLEHSTPMGLRPLKSNISEPQSDDFVADTQISFEASLTEDELSKNILAENIEEPVSSAVQTPSSRKSLFGSSPKVSEPLELDEDAIIMPNPDIDIDKEDPFTQSSMAVA